MILRRSSRSRTRSSVRCATSTRGASRCSPTLRRRVPRRPRSKSIRALLALLLALLPAWAGAQSWSGILAPERARDWTLVGIPGGIPNRTTVCATVTPSSGTAAIQSAIDNCPVGQVVSFAAGTYNISSIHVTKGITLRGQGANQTYLNITGNVLLGHYGDGGYPQNGFPVNWTGGLTRGSTVLTVASTSGMSSGMTIILDEHNPAWVTTQGYNGNCNPSNTCGRLDASPWFWGGGGPRAQGQMTKVVSVDSATQITIRDPVAYTHTAGLQPQVFWWSSPSYGSGNREGAGIENMKIYSNDNNYTVDMAWCDYCYAKGLSILQNARGAIRAYWAYGFVIRDNYIASTNTGAPTQYGYEILMSSNGLVENNIAYTVTAPFMPQSSHAIIFAYNYTLNRSALLGGSANQFADAQPHLAHNSFELWEGNDMATIDYDVIWGSASHSTMYRNRFSGLQPSKTAYTRAVEISAWNRFMNVVANVIGTVGYHTTYRCTYVGDWVNNNYATIYDLANAHSCGGPNNANVSYDATTYSSLMRWGNWDAVTYAANGNANGTRYCTGSGAGNAACTEDERGSGDPTFPGLANPSQSFPASFYLAGKPSWFGSVPWPPIGPDVTCSSNCDSNAASHVNKIPARLCYESSSKDANGYLTSFDPTTCYAAAALLPAPTNLRWIITDWMRSLLARNGEGAWLSLF